jgi:EAL domain-containing protein (putative c-di-GMP-specific phosphodiesterase class I)
LTFHQLVAFADGCRELGAQFALDDCTPHHEYCTPQSLRILRPVLLKLDGGMFANAFHRGDAVPVKLIADLAGDIGARVVAEHVESAAMCDWALAHGADLLQGFHFGPAAPLPAVLPQSFVSYSAY